MLKIIHLTQDIWMFVVYTEISRPFLLDEYTVYLTLNLIIHKINKIIVALKT